MSAAEIQNVALSVLTGLLSSSLFVVGLFIGFCVIVGFTKTKKTRGGNVPVIKSLDEAVSHQTFNYLPPNAPRGHADPLKVW